MAYIPPHKRRSKDDDTERPSLPRPEFLSPLFNKKPQFRSSSTKNVSTHKITDIANKAIWRWFAVGLDDRNQFPSSVRLQPVSHKSVQAKNSETHLALIYTDLDEDSSSAVRERVLESPWVYIAENVTRDLISSFENVRKEMENNVNEEVRPSLVARFGKIIFISSSLESMTEDLASEDKLSNLKRFLNSSLPKSYMEYIIEEGAQKIGFELEEDKDVYYVQFSDSTRPNSIMSCKCRVLSKDGKLEICKIEFGRARQMVMDISCLENNVDLRLILCTKRIVHDLFDDDMQSIRNLIGSAVIDTMAKGGLRWPLGKATSGDKFTVCGAWHSKSKTYFNSSMRLKVREVNQFNFRTSIGESCREICVSLKNLSSHLKAPHVDEDMIKGMLEEDLRALWGSFFCCESYLKW